MNIIAGYFKDMYLEYSSVSPSRLNIRGEVVSTDEKAAKGYLTQFAMMISDY